MRKRERLPAHKARRNLPQELEPLESRRMLAANPFDTSKFPVIAPTNSTVADSKNGPMGNAGQTLISLYRDFSRYTGNVNSYQSKYSYLDIRNGMVRVRVRGRSPSGLQSTLQSNSAQVISSSSKYGVADAFVPIGRLLSLSKGSSVVSVSPLPRPMFLQQGTGNNQADETQIADQIRSIYGLDGTGVKIGVLSNSVDRVGNGIGGSIATGDLPAEGVHVIQDWDVATVTTDEGRAMLELIHDIAPGAELGFATTGFSQMTFAENITALKEWGADIIVDDVIFLDEPFFQPGVIDQSIKSFVDSGGIYFSAVGNFDDDGFESAANWVTVNNQRYIDFDPGPAVDTLMSVTLFPASGSATTALQWDDPYNGVSGNASADVDILFYQTINGKRTLVASGQTNNLRTGLPVEIVSGLPSGVYNVQIRLRSVIQGKPLPTRFKFAGPMGLLSTEYLGIRSGTWGHNAGPNTVSIGAVPFFSAPPYAPLSNSEDFSSFGPVTQIFDANGLRLATPITLSKPDVSGIDQSNTSFFTGGVLITGGNIFALDIPDDPDALPNFPGTSAAAPNVAAVAALMLQEDPTATQEQILNAFKATARPLNGAAPGEYDTQGGFGLIDGLAAIELFVKAPTATVRGPTSITYKPIGSLKVTFSQQVSGFDISDLILSVDDGPNLLTGANIPVTTDGGRTWTIKNLGSVTTEAGTYTFLIDDGDQSIVNAIGIPLSDSTVATFEIAEPPGLPDAPSSLKALATSSSSVKLTWKDNSISEARFQIQRSIDTRFRGDLKTFNVSANKTSFNDTTVAKAGQVYFYRIRAINGSGGSSDFSAPLRIASLAPGELILDNNSGGVTVTGAWNVRTSGSGFLGENYLDDGNSGKGAKSVLYTPNVQFSGTYQLYVRWVKGSDRATNVPIDISVNGGVTTKTVVVDQRNTGGEGWISLGKFTLTKGKKTTILIRTDGTNGKVVVDSVRFQPMQFFG